MRLLEQICCYILCFYSISTYIYNVLVDVFSNAVHFRQWDGGAFQINLVFDVVFSNEQYVTIVLTECTEISSYIIERYWHIVNMLVIHYITRKSLRNTYFDI